MLPSTQLKGTVLVIAFSIHGPVQGLGLGLLRCTAEILTRTEVAVRRQH